MQWSNELAKQRCSAWCIAIEKRSKGKEVSRTWDFGYCRNSMTQFWDRAYRPSTIISPNLSKANRKKWWDCLKYLHFLRMTCIHKNLRLGQWPSSLYSGCHNHVPCRRRIKVKPQGRVPSDSDLAVPSDFRLLLLANLCLCTSLLFYIQLLDCNIK